MQLEKLLCEMQTCSPLASVTTEEDFVHPSVPDRAECERRPPTHDYAGRKSCFLLEFAVRDVPYELGMGGFLKLRPRRIFQNPTTRTASPRYKTPRESSSRGAVRMV